MPSTRRHLYDLNFKLKIVAEAKAVNNNRGIAREHGISKSMVRKLRNQQHVLFSGELRDDSEPCIKDAIERRILSWISS